MNLNKALIWTSFASLERNHFFFSEVETQFQVLSTGIPAPSFHLKSALLKEGGGMLFYLQCSYSP